LISTTVPILPYGWVGGGRVIRKPVSAASNVAAGPIRDSRRHRCWQIRCPGLRAELPHLGELLVGRVEAYLQAVDLAQPTAFGRFAQSVVEVDDDGQQSRLLRRVGPQDRAPDAPLTELTAEFGQLLTLRRESADSLPA
jgi:hypothetical protein